MALPSIASMTSLAKITSTYLNSIKAALDWRMDPPHVHVFNATGPAFANTVQTLCAWPDEREDWTTTGMHSTSVNTSRITLPEDGRYLIISSVALATTTVPTTVEVMIRKNAAGNAAGGTSIRTEPFYSTNPVKWPLIERFAAGDYIEQWVTQTSGASRNMSATSHGYGLIVEWLGK